MDINTDWRYMMNKNWYRRHNDYDNINGRDRNEILEKTIADPVCVAFLNTLEYKAYAYTFINTEYIIILN